MDTSDKVPIFAWIVREGGAYPPTFTIPPCVSKGCRIALSKDRPPGTPEACLEGIWTGGNMEYTGGNQISIFAPMSLASSRTMAVSAGQAGAVTRLRSTTASVTGTGT